MRERTEPERKHCMFQKLGGEEFGGGGDKKNAEAKNIAKKENSNAKAWAERGKIECRRSSTTKFFQGRSNEKAGGGNSNFAPQRGWKDTAGTSARNGLEGRKETLGA